LKTHNRAYPELSNLFVRQDLPPPISAFLLEVSAFKNNFGDGDVELVNRNSVIDENRLAPK
jgi:hypothetical protein